MLGTLKVTQNTAKDTWSNVPLMDFSKKSPINWDSSISEIDKQLFLYFNLTKDEIEFIELTADSME